MTPNSVKIWIFIFAVFLSGYDTFSQTIRPDTMNVGSASYQIISDITEIKSIIERNSVKNANPSEPFTFRYKNYDETISGLIYGINFKSQFSFNERIIKSKLDFSNIIFSESFNSVRTKFGFDTSFLTVKFNNSNFSSCSFNRQIKFIGCSFKGLNFELCQFGSSITIMNSNFEEGIKLKETSLPDSLFFYDNKFSRDVDFSTALNSKFKCKIFLILNNYTDLSNIILPSDKFTLGFEKIPSKDTLIEIPFQYKAYAYEQIIKKCQSLGMTESVQGWTIEFKELKNIHYYSETWGTALNWLHNIWWGFGYERQRIIYCAISLFFIFSLLNILLMPNLLRKTYYDAEISKNFLPADTNNAEKLIDHLLNESKGYRIFINVFTYSLHYTGIIFFGLKVKHEALNTKTPWVLYFYFVYIIGIIHLAGIAAYILK